MKWAHAQRTLHGLQSADTKMFTERTNFSELNQMAEEARRRAEIARYDSILYLRVKNVIYVLAPQTIPSYIQNIGNSAHTHIK